MHFMGGTLTVVVNMFPVSGVPLSLLLEGG